MIEIKEQGEGWLTLKNFIDDAELYLEYNQKNSIPSYLEIRYENKEGSVLYCIDLNGLEDVAKILATISKYCFGVEKHIEDIVDILDIEDDYKKAKEKEQESKHD